MIEFSWHNYHKDGTPIIKDLNIMGYAELLLKDYRPELLKEPGRINPEHFLENYLGATLDYQDIYYDEGDDAIAGATVFNNEKIRVFDREQMSVNTIDVAANTIIIDNGTMKEGREGFALFTMLHEGGHLCLHPGVYRQTEGQMSLFSGMAARECCVKCKRSAIQTNKKTLVTQEDFREHQANVFAATIAMPRQTYIPTAKELIRKAGLANKEGIIVIPDSYSWSIKVAIDEVVDHMTDIYGTSASANEVHLRYLGLMVEEKNYMRQTRLFYINSSR